MSTPRSDDALTLASASPRRRRLLAWLGLPYAVTSADIDEDLSVPLADEPERLAIRLAEEKALAARHAGAGGLVIGCDTIVVHAGEVMGKPVDLDDAWRMLRTLSGTVHQVVTGVALLPSRAEAAHSFAVTTDVAMRALSDDDIAAWARSGELLGCAGAYNIERHLASVELTECFQNVAGLPLCHLYRELADGGRGERSGLTSPVAACDAARGVRCRLGPTLVG